jgi:hypothetical protein
MPGWENTSNWSLVRQSTAKNAAIRSGLNVNDPRQWAARMAAGDPHIGIATQKIIYGGDGRFYTYDGEIVGPPVDADTVRQLATSAQSRPRSEGIWEKVALGIIAAGFGEVAVGAIGAAGDAADAVTVSEADTAAIASDGQVAAEVAQSDLAVDAEYGAVAASDGGGTGFLSGATQAIEKGAGWVAKTAGSAAISKLAKGSSSAGAQPHSQSAMPTAQPMDATRIQPAEHKGFFQIIGEFLVETFNQLAGKAS